MPAAASSVVSSSAAQQNREAVTLEELKSQLHFVSSTKRATGPAGKDKDGNGTDANSPVAAIGPNGNLSDAAINGFLLRFLRAKHLSTADAIAKLKRRRTFERTLPTISVTPAVLSVLRSGAISVIGKDLKQRPVLYINLHDYCLPPLEVDEVQRLLIILLEYMQAQCLASAPDSVPSGSANTTEAYQQQFALLINEEDSPWHGHQPLLSKASTVYTIVSKYYPQLLDLVLLIGATFEVRQDIKAALAYSPESVKSTIQMVQRGDLTRYMSRAVIPASLGGDRPDTDSALDFCESVMRHWYTLTSYLQLEYLIGATAPQRPLYLPTPKLISSQQFVAMQRRMITAGNVPTSSGASAHGSRVQRRNSQLISGRRESSSFAINDVSARDGATSLASSHRGLDLNTNWDDGVCSALSFDDADIDLDEEGEERAMLTALSAPAELINDADGGDQPNEDADQVVHALQQERARRRLVEQRLQMFELGVALDPQNTTTVERELGAIHQNVNVLAADVVQRAKAADGRGAVPTLGQLLDLTLSAIETAANLKEEVPAMAFAVPAQRDESSSTCCSVM